MHNIQVFFLLLNIKYQIKWLWFTPLKLFCDTQVLIDRNHKESTNIFATLLTGSTLGPSSGFIVWTLQENASMFCVWQAPIGNPDGDHRLVQTAGAAGRAPGGDWPQELFVCCLSFIYCALWASGVSTKARSIMRGGDLPGKESWPASSHC